MKKLIITILVLVLAGIGIYLYKDTLFAPNPNPTDTEETEEEVEETEEEVTQERETVLGKSVEGREITAYHYGTGDTEVLFVGGIHGGYSWNTALVAYELMDYLEASPEVIPSNVRVTVVPVLNPDGLYEVTGTAGRFTKADVSNSQSVLVSGRFNANNVDLSRNFDCNWKSSAVWQTTSVSGGSRAFSEPESRAIQTYVTANKPDAAVVWYSAAGGVYASSCNNGVSALTSSLTNLYADASGYPAHESFDFYETTGDMVNWLAKNNIPAISVLLSTHNDVEWDKNKKGIDALLQNYAE